MKKIPFFILFLFALFIFNDVSGQRLAKKYTKKIVGTWKIENISVSSNNGQNQTEQSKNLIKELLKDASFVFNENKDCNFSLTEIQKTGKWSVSESGKQLTIELYGVKSTYDILILKKSVCRLENKIDNELKIMILYR